MSGEWLS